MNDTIQSPIDLNNKGLVPGADPYIAQLVLLAELEKQRSETESESYVVLEARVSKRPLEEHRHPQSHALEAIYG